jgi:phosphatidylinositol alpha-mannosyltransferase
VAAANWGSDLQLVPNAVAPPNIEIERVPGQVVFIGRDERRKGVQVLLDAWPIVRQEVPHAELHLTIEGLAHRGVIKHGRVTEQEKWRLLKSAEVAVAPALFGESFGLVVAEALAAGVPLVMSDLEAFKNVAGSAAVVVPAGDSDALGVAVAALLRDKGERLRRAETGRAAVSRFGITVVLTQYRKLYQDAIDQANQQPPTRLGTR